MNKAPLFAEMFWEIVNDDSKSRNIAISSDSKSVTYRELGEAVAARAQAFLDTATATGPVVLLQERTVELCVDVLAGLCSGVPVSILSKTDSVDLSCSKLRAIGAHQIIADQGCHALAQQLAEKAGADLSVRSDLSAHKRQAGQPCIPERSEERREWKKCR